VGQATDNSDSTLDEDNEQSSQLYNHTNLILEQCQPEEAAPVSGPDIAVALFQKALNLCPGAHPLQLASIKDLSVALLTWFSWEHEEFDLEWAIELHIEGWGNISAGRAEQSQLAVCVLFFGV
jgi:hypothetical protein